MFLFCYRSLQAILCTTTSFSYIDKNFSIPFMCISVEPYERSPLLDGYLLNGVTSIECQNLHSTSFCILLNDNLVTTLMS